MMYPLPGRFITSHTDIKLFTEGITSQYWWRGVMVEKRGRGEDMPVWKEGYKGGGMFWKKGLGGHW